MTAYLQVFTEPRLSSHGIEWRGQLCALDKNAPTLPRRDSAKALRKYRRQRARVVGRQPQPQQMPPPLEFGPVLKGRPVMQQGVIVHQLHVSRRQIHVEVQRRVVG